MNNVHRHLLGTCAISKKASSRPIQSVQSEAAGATLARLHIELWTSEWPTAACCAAAPARSLIYLDILNFFPPSSLFSSAFCSGVWGARGGRDQSIQPRGRRCMHIYASCDNDHGVCFFPYSRVLCKKRCLTAATNFFISSVCATSIIY